jgi:hypothetical protein
MMLRRRLVPVAALVVAIGASAAGAATAAETGSGGSAGAAHKTQKPVTCKVVLPGGVLKKGGDVTKANLPAGGDAALAAAKAAAKAGGQSADKTGGKTADKSTDKGKPEPKGGKPPVEDCKKPVKVVSLDTIAAKLGVSKAALVQALDQTKQWLISSPTKPSVGQFEQHLADLLHVPVSKVVSVFGSDAHVAVTPGA